MVRRQTANLLMREFDSPSVLQIMKKLQARWELRTDGRTVIDDINDLRSDSERYQRMMNIPRGDMSYCHYIACRGCQEKLWIGQGGVIYTGEPDTMKYLADFITERHLGHDTFTTSDAHAHDVKEELLGMKNYVPDEDSGMG